MTTYALATVLFIVTTFAVAATIAAAVAHSAPTGGRRRRYGLIAAGVLAAWLGLTAALAALGALDDFSPPIPQVMRVILLGNLGAVVLAASPLGRRIAVATPITWLVGFQVFRVAVEVVLALLYHAGVMPVQMSFEGRNWDILVGLTALPVAWLAARGRLSRQGLLVWNLLGLGLLANIVIISILSMPIALRAFPDDPANTFITTAPYVWLPTLLVPTALGGHLLALHHLLLPLARGSLRVVTADRRP